MKDQRKNDGEETACIASNQPVFEQTRESGKRRKGDLPGTHPSISCHSLTGHPRAERREREPLLESD